MSDKSVEPRSHAAPAKLGRGGPVELPDPHPAPEWIEPDDEWAPSLHGVKVLLAVVSVIGIALMLVTELTTYDAPEPGPLALMVGAAVLIVGLAARSALKRR